MTRIILKDYDRELHADHGQYRDKGKRTVRRIHSGILPASLKKDMTDAAYENREELPL